MGYPAERAQTIPVHLSKKSGKSDPKPRLREPEHNGIVPTRSEVIHVSSTHDAVEVNSLRCA